MLAPRLQELRFWVRPHWLLMELWVPRGHQGQQIDASGDRASACDLCSLRRRPGSVTTLGQLWRPGAPARRQLWVWRTKRGPSLQELAAPRTGVLGVEVKAGDSRPPSSPVPCETRKAVLCTRVSSCTLVPGPGRRGPCAQRQPS